MTALKHVVKVAVAVVPVTALARLGMPALVASVALAALLVFAILGLAIWVIGDEQRSQRMEKLLTAARGRAEAPASAQAIEGISVRARRRFSRRG
jgi:hypothetical protein